MPRPITMIGYAHIAVNIPSRSIIHPRRLYHVCPPNSIAGSTIIATSSTPSAIPIIRFVVCCVITKYTQHSDDQTSMPMHQYTYDQLTRRYSCRSGSGGVGGISSSGNALDGARAPIGRCLAGSPGFFDLN